MSSLRFVPATLDDASYAADIFTENEPDDPADGLLIRHFWSNPHQGSVAERYVVTAADGERVGFAAHFHQDWAKLPTRYGQVNGVLRTAAKTVTLLDAVFAYVEERSRESETAIFVANAGDADVLRQEVLLARGYAEERRFKIWECDLRANAAMLRAALQDARRKMRGQDVRLVTFDRIEDPEKMRRFWELSETTTGDMPTTVPYVPEPFEVFVRGWMGRPGFREDRLWIALAADRMLGYSVLAYPPTRGLVWNNGTAVIREARGRGLARALKLESMVQAIDAGTPKIRTGNDSTNAPILHLNEVLGFGPVPGGIQFMRPA
ncbi:MAG TPA: hypothetical protein VIN34_02995 [Candidatus Limnocylindria bacterium]|jgi:GNAT superfamily N-acetyltransferase